MAARMAKPPMEAPATTPAETEGLDVADEVADEVVETTCVVGWVMMDWVMMIVDCGEQMEGRTCLVG